MSAFHQDWTRLGFASLGLMILAARQAIWEPQRSQRAQREPGDRGRAKQGADCRDQGAGKDEAVDAGLRLQATGYRKGIRDGSFPAAKTQNSEPGTDFL